MDLLLLLSPTPSSFFLSLVIVLLSFGDNSLVRIQKGTTQVCVVGGGGGGGGGGKRAARLHRLASPLAVTPKTTLVI